MHIACAVSEIIAAEDAKLHMLMHIHDTVGVTIYVDPQKLGFSLQIYSFIRSFIFV